MDFWFSQAAGTVFIHSYDRNCGIIRHFINVRNILHTGYEFYVFFGRNVPIDIFVRSKLFFSVRRLYLSGYQVQHGLFLLKAEASCGNVHPAQDCKQFGLFC